MTQDECNETFDAGVASCASEVATLKRQLTEARTALEICADRARRGMRAPIATRGYDAVCALADVTRAARIGVFRSSDEFKG